MADIVLTGYMARHPLAGNMLAYFQYVLGLSRLGHRVVYVEESGWPNSAYDPVTGECSDFPAEGLRRTRALVDAHCPGVPVVFVDRESGAVDGATPTQLRTWLQSCDALIDIGGVCWLEDFASAPRRALIDMDPLFTQVSGFAFDRLDAYDVHFTYGANIGTPGCSVPTAGHTWTGTAPPVVLDLWAEQPPPSRSRFTTIANWTAYGGVEYQGRVYGQKDVEFRRLATLPQGSAATFEIAIAGGGETEQMRRHGWAFTAAAEVTDSVAAYQRYIAGSSAEFSAAKNAYVASGSGWFSDRSACYLASGRPVILQNTGFGQWLPTGAGLLAYDDLAGARAAVDDVLANYAHHAAAARRIAADHLAHDVVLPRLVAAVCDAAMPVHGGGR